MIDECCGITSTGKVACDIAEKFERDGHEVKVAYGRVDFVPEKFRKFAVRIGTKKDVVFHAIMTRLTDRNGFFSRRATRKFLRWADDYDPDFLWLHNIHGYYINVAMLFNWIKSRPNMKVNWTLHDCWAFTGHCAYFTKSGCEKWKTHCSACPDKKSYPSSLIDSSYRNYEDKRRLFTGVKNMKLITPSKWLAGLVKESFLKDYPVEVKNNTIDKEIFKPSPSDFRQRFGLDDKIVILGVANVWNERKGLNDFLRLSEVLDPEKFAIVLVGVKKKLPERIIVIEKTNNQKELAEIYTASDFLFLPSYEENYPTVSLEAEACGTPVIAYDAGGSPETLKDPRSKVVKPGDFESVKEILEKAR